MPQIVPEFISVRMFWNVICGTVSGTGGGPFSRSRPGPGTPFRFQGCGTAQPGQIATIPAWRGRPLTAVEAMVVINGRTRTPFAGAPTAPTPLGQLPAKVPRRPALNIILSGCFLEAWA